MDRCDNNDLQAEVSPDENSLPAAPRKVNGSFHPTNTSTENIMEATTCRREIVWMGLGPDMKLSNMLNTYQNVLPEANPPFDSTSSLLSSLSFSRELPRRSGWRRSSTRHSCTSYQREEITFTPDPVRNAVIIFHMPSINEICPMCGQVVTPTLELVQEDGLEETEESVATKMAGGPQGASDVVMSSEDNFSEWNGRMLLEQLMQGEENERIKHGPEWRRRYNEQVQKPSEEETTIVAESVDAKMTGGPQGENEVFDELGEKNAGRMLLEALMRSEGNDHI